MQENCERQRRPAGESRDLHVQTQDEKKAVQKRTFTRWMNVFLQRRDRSIRVDDLFTDIQDGRILMALLEELSGCKLLYRFRSSSHRIFRLNNISKALVFLDDRHVKLLGIDAPSIADGISSVVLNLIWNVILHFQVVFLTYHSSILKSYLTPCLCVCFLSLISHTLFRFTPKQVKEVTAGLRKPLSSSLSSLSESSHPSSDDLSPQANDIGSDSSNTLPSKGRRAAREPKYHGKSIKTLLQWVQRCTSKYGVDVHDFGKSWRSGLAFLALIKSINSDLVDLRESLSKEPKENIQQAFILAHRSLDVPPLLEPEDVTCTSPDEKSIITYVSMFLGLHSGMEEDQATNSEVPEIPNFGSSESVSLGDTLAGDPETETLLKSLEKSREQRLWRRWSVRSSLCKNGAATSDNSYRQKDQSVAEEPVGQFTKKTGKSRSSPQPPSPLDATIVSQDIRSWMEMDSDVCFGKKRPKESHFSLSSEEGIYSLSVLDSDEEDAYSYILDLNKEVFQPYSQLKRQVPKVQEETAEEMMEESKHLEAHEIVNSSQEISMAQNTTSDLESKVRAQSGMHRKFDLERKESIRRDMTDNRGEFDIEPEAESGKKEEWQQERVARGESNSNGGFSEDVGEKKIESVRLVRDRWDETEENAAKAETSEVDCWQESVEEGGEKEHPERCRQVSEWKRAQEEDEREHLPRFESEHNLENVRGEREVKEEERRTQQRVNSGSGKVGVNGNAVLHEASYDFNALRTTKGEEDGRNGEKMNIFKNSSGEETMVEDADKAITTKRDGEHGQLKTRADLSDPKIVPEVAAEVLDANDVWTPACSSTPQSFSCEGGFTLQYLAASCDITPLELELLFVLWILLYCCLILPHMNL